MFKSFKSVGKLSEAAEAIEKYGQGENHREVAEAIREYTDRHGDADVIKRNDDYAILRYIEYVSDDNGRRFPRPKYILVGFLSGSRESGLFAHRLPYGEIDYESCNWQEILDYVNRTKEGFQRIQGDVIYKEIGRYEAGIYELENGSATLGNNHEIRGKCLNYSDIYNRRIDNIKFVANRENPITISHPEHNSVTIQPEDPTIYEFSLQRSDPDSVNND